MSFCKEKTLPIGPSVRLGLVVLGSGYFLKWEKKKKKKKKKFCSEHQALESVWYNFGGIWKSLGELLVLRGRILEEWV
jgi:hypothetical protein